jgi:hypothetical protein
LDGTGLKKANTDHTEKTRIAPVVLRTHGASTEKINISPEIILDQSVSSDPIREIHGQKQPKATGI